MLSRGVVHLQRIADALGMLMVIPDESSGVGQRLSAVDGMRVKLHPKDKVAIVVGTLSVLGMLFGGFAYLFTTKQDHTADVSRVERAVEKHVAVEIQNDKITQETVNKLSRIAESQESRMREIEINQRVQMAIDGVSDRQIEQIRRRLGR